MDRETIKWVLEILRDTDGDMALNVICDLDVDYIIGRMLIDENEE